MQLHGIGGINSGMGCLAKNHEAEDVAIDDCNVHHVTRDSFPKTLGGKLRVSRCGYPHSGNTGDVCLYSSPYVGIHEA
jgi:hypothetical protein